MAKKSFLAGLDKETRDKIYGIRREANAKKKEDEDKKSEQYKNKLLAIQKSFNKTLDEAKVDKLIPHNTTIAKIGMLPSKPPKRWASTYNRIFGRRKVKAKVKAQAKSIVSRISSAVSASKPAPKPKAKKKAPAKK